jgi:putative CocE/NonD family hydrolase
MRRTRNVGPSFRIPQSTFRNLAVVGMLPLVVLAAGCARLFGPGALPPAETTTQMVAMRDHVRLATDVYLPKTGGPFPAILIRTPYGKGNEQNIVARLLVAAGYAVAIQDVRGRYDSEGEWAPFIHEGPDGADTVDWARGQRWCDGKIGLFGMSYFGFTQWQAATAAGAHVTTFTPSVTTSRIYDVLYRGGAFHLLLGAGWGLANPGRRSGAEFGFNPAHWTTPLLDLDRSQGKPAPFWADWIRHHSFDDYWRPASSEGRWENIAAPALLVGGWYDIFGADTLADWRKITTQAGPRARRESKLVMGPWNHGFSRNMKGVDFGGAADFLPFAKNYVLWFNEFLKGERGPDLPRVRVFTTGIDEWQDYNDWPPPAARAQRWNFHSGGHAERGGDGELLPAGPGREIADGFAHDARNLVPTLGGAIFPPEFAGPADVAAYSKRADVLAYTSQELGADLHLAGKISAVVWVEADTPDIDVAVTLADVAPNGVARLLVDGLTRARFRNGDNPEWLAPGQPAAVTVDLGGMSHVVKRGHRLRVYVAASNFPHYAPNPCSREDAGAARTLNSSQVRVLHDGEHPSYLAVDVHP